MGEKYLYEKDIGTAKPTKNAVVTKNTHSNGYITGTGSSYSGSNAPTISIGSNNTGVRYSGSSAPISYPGSSASISISNVNEQSYEKYSAGLEKFTDQIKNYNSDLRFSIIGDATREQSSNKEWKIDGSFRLATRQYGLADLTTAPAADEDVYIINPYKQNSYIKKTVRRELINNEDSPISTATIDKLQNLPLNYKKFLEKWKLADRFIDDAMIKLRGEVIEDNVFLKERQTSIMQSIREFLKDSSKETYDLEKEFSNSTDGMIRLYNFAKAAIELSTQESKNDLYQTYRYRPLLRPDNYSYRIYLERIPFEGLAQDDSADRIGRIITSKNSKGAMKSRSIIEKLANTDRFSTENEYRDAYSQMVASNIILETAQNGTDFIANPNYHLKNIDRIRLDNKNLSFSNESEHLQKLTADSLRRFSKTLQPIYLAIDFQDDIIDSTIPERNTKETEGSITGTEKAVFNYLLADPIKASDISGERSPTEFAISKILDSIIMPETIDGEDTVMEVLNGN